MANMTEVQKRAEHMKRVRAPAYLVLMRILVEEEVPFLFTGTDDHIYVQDVTADELRSALEGPNNDLLRSNSRDTYAFKNVDGMFVRIVSEGHGRGWPDLVIVSSDIE